MNEVILNFRYYHRKHRCRIPYHWLCCIAYRSTVLQNCNRDCQWKMTAGSFSSFHCCCSGVAISLHVTVLMLDIVSTFCEGFIMFSVLSWCRVHSAPVFYCYTLEQLNITWEYLFDCFLNVKIWYRGGGKHNYRQTLHCWQNNCDINYSVSLWYTDETKKYCCLCFVDKFMAKFSATVVLLK